MRTSLAILFIVLAQPAVACHRFHVWKYPYPQRCQIVTRDDKTWFVEITKLPDDIDRERAIDMLREQLSGYQTQPEGR